MDIFLENAPTDLPPPSPDDAKEDPADARATFSSNVPLARASANDLSRATIDSISASLAARCAAFLVSSILASALSARVFHAFERVVSRSSRRARSRASSSRSWWRRTASASLSIADALCATTSFAAASATRAAPSDADSARSRARMRAFSEAIVVGVFVFEGVGAGEEGLGRGDGSRVHVCIVIVIIIIIVIIVLVVVVVILASCVRCLEELRGGRRGRRADAPGDLIGLFVVRWRRVAVGSLPGRSFHERLETRLHLHDFFLALRGGAALLGELLARALGDEPLAFGGLAAGGELPSEQQQRGSLSLLQHRITSVVTR